MKLYSDNKCKTLVESINFGTVEASNEKELVIYIKNDSESVLENLAYEFPSLPDTEKLEILNAPKTMQPGAIESMKIRWQPSLNFKKALNVSLEISGNEVYYTAATT